MRLSCLVKIRILIKEKIITQFYGTISGNLPFAVFRSLLLSQPDVKLLVIGSSSFQIISAMPRT